MVTILCTQQYEERPNHITNTTVTGNVFQTTDYPTITPARFLIISSSQKELRTIQEWIEKNDSKAEISTIDSVDGIKHSFEADLYNKETVVLLKMIWG